MAYNFPNSPSNGDTVVINGSTYTYASATNTWKTTASSGGGGASVTSSDTAPTNPSDGDLWWNSAEAIMYVYYNDGSSSQWVSTSTPGPRGESGLNVTTSNTAPSSPTAGQFWWNTDVNRLYIYYTDADSSQWVQATTPGADGAAGTDGADGSSVTSYANYAAFPTSGNSVGDFAFATDTKAVYIWDGSEWDRISTGVDETPIILTEPVTSVKLNSDGSTSTVTMLAEDPEGFDITYGIVYKTAGNSRPLQLNADTTIDQSNGIYTFTPSSNTSNAGSFRARLSASDGTRTTTRLVDFDLGFIPQSAALIGHYDFGDTDSYSGTGTTITDLSGAGNDVTLVVGSGSMGTDVYNFATNTSINLGVLAAQKTIMFVWIPPDPYSNHIHISGNGGPPYTSIFSTGSGDFYYPTGGWGTWANESVEYLINGGNPGNSRNTAYNKLTLTKYNSSILSGIQMTSSTMYYNTYNSWTAAHGLRAILAWNVVLTATEKEEVHNYYVTKVGSSNMVAWTP